MSVITRFAPSPTGLLHIGNVRTALVCYLFSKKQGGKFMLRLDDTDTERSKTEYSEAIQQDLQWLGLQWDFMARQSERMARYEEIKQKLLADGRLYPCYETAEDLEIKRKMQLSRGLPPIYDRAALKLSDAEKKQLEAQGLKPHWRFKLLENEAIEWNDLIKGPTRFEAKNLSDPVVFRANGSPTYLLPSAVDDMDFKITHIVRGEDHVTNTAIQIQIFKAIGSHIPQFAHQSLMKSKTGKISKREGGFDIGSLRKEGIEPMTINSFLARLGTSDPIEARATLEELIAHFDITRFSKTSTIYDDDELDRLNPKVIQLYSFAQVKDRLKVSGISDIDETFWNSVRLNLKYLAEIKEWWQICKEAITPVIDDPAFTVQASALLPQGHWDETTWNIWVEEVKKATGRKGKELFMPLRKALTAREHGPELKYILPLIGREKALARLNNKAA